MTALDRYVRLESDALWRETPEGQRRNVVLSFGDATLVIADEAGRPLSHWSLPAVQRLNPKIRPALYSPDGDTSETLEIADETMVEAIEIVRKSLSRGRAQPGKLRYWITAGLLGLFVGLAFFWAPGALTRQTLAAIPQAKSAEIGRAILARMETRTGPRCLTPEGSLAARKLAQRLFGNSSDARIVVLPNLPQRAVALPGAIYALDGTLMARADDPAAIAGYVLAADVGQPTGGALAPLLKDAGISVTLGLLTRGTLPESLLDAAADQFTAILPTNFDGVALSNALAGAQVPQAPFLALVDRQTGSMPQLDPDPLAGQPIPLILSDVEWVSLQNICQ